jgi:hypothetical protein
MPGSEGGLCKSGVCKSFGRRSGGTVYAETEAQVDVPAALAGHWPSASVFLSSDRR